MTVPDWYALVLLSLAAYRVWRLLAVDTILNKPRRALVRLGWKWMDGDPLPKRYREEWGVFLECPWCLGFWVSIAWFGAFQLWEHAALVVAAPFAVSALVGFGRARLDPPE